MNTTPYAPRVPIREYLARRGILPRYERNGYSMYLSPLREERTPSFKVNYQKDLWYDFGIGEGGTLLALIMRLERCSRSEAFEHLQHAAEGVVSLLAARICKRYARPTESPNSQPALRILSDAPLRHPALFGYLASRGIVPGIAAAYCREVRYQVRNHCFFAIGFRNDCGGWELRSERFKGSSSPKQITTVDHQSDKVIVFEGFMDFLACLSMKHPAPFGRHSSELGGQPAEGASFPRTASDDPCLSGQRRGGSSYPRRTDPSVSSQPGDRPCASLS